MQLPENAFRELKPGETYTPIVPADSSVPEVPPRSIAFGLAMTVLFSAAAAFIALKLGQGIESAIPIAILSIGLSAVLARKSTLLEYVNIVTLGATAGIVVGGSTFTMPAIFILGLDERSGCLKGFIVPLLGAILGVMFLIPFRRYFVAEMHGKLPFPEATATTQILVTGGQGGKQALVLLYSMGIGVVLDFLALHFRLWRDTFSTVLIPQMRTFTEEMKAIFVLNTSSSVLGLGYIVGLKYASIICAGSFVPYYVFVPLFAKFGPMIQGELLAGRPPIAGLDAVPAQTAERRLTLEDSLARLPRLDIAWHGAAANTPDADALTVVGTVLSGGRSSRFYESLVRQQQLTSGASAFNQSSRGPGLFRVSSVAAPGKSIGDLEAAIYAEIEKVKTGSIAAWEIEKAANNEKRSFAAGLGNSLQRAVLLGEYALFWDNPNLINTYVDRMSKVTAADVQRVARQFLVPATRNVVITNPKAAASKERQR